MANNKLKLLRFVRKMSIILHKVTKEHASSDVVYYCLYGYFFLGERKSKLAKTFNKSKSTISRWIKQYLDNNLYSRSETKKLAKFNDDQRSWLLKLYDKNPTTYLHEAKIRFFKKFHVEISVSSICRILHHSGYSWKTLERRAIQIREDDITRFFFEMSSIQWDLSSLLFLDEVSFDNRGMLRKKGYGVKGNRLIHTGEFVRKPRISMLCFLGQSGLQACYQTEGTFTRKIFFDYLRDFALSDKVRTYPGQHSVFILDGARIHCDPNITTYLRSLGLIVIFLPAYCPFYNPIEIIFGLCKRSMKKTYNEGDDLQLTVARTMTKFTIFDSTALFNKCGYNFNGTFDPTKNM